ncbi:hypothetical protein BS47DRAFT_41527 [Hydnum rufescens UP504]|uniref:PUB domain-containing protein n=1 Tax=Hydnum rufescens UP504 TaxID=1448309 RepID=A0A9P6ASG5_9AGAM|nr:hypothetical protein BS47DRAFT_41527 [Hydnum rufescens UP504]
MSSSDPASSSAPAVPAREIFVNAALTRSSEARTDPSIAEEKANHEEKKMFRRLLSAGIQRHNDAKLAIESIKTLLKLANNILEHPDEGKYCQFKRTNPTIQRYLVEPKSSMEYAIACGFRADVVNFQPIYVFNPTPKNIRSLRNGADCLQEVVEREVTTKEHAKAARDAEKKAQARQRELVRLAYEDDRKEKHLRDELDRQRRDAIAQAQARAALETQELEDNDDGLRVYGHHLHDRCQASHHSLSPFADGGENASVNVQPQAKTSQDSPSGEDMEKEDGHDDDDE